MTKAKERLQKISRNLKEVKSTCDDAILIKTQRAQLMNELIHEKMMRSYGMFQALAQKKDKARVDQMA